MSEVQPSPVGHTQVPPVSEIMAALTDILSIRQVTKLANKQNMTDDVRHRSLKGQEQSLARGSLSVLIRVARTHVVTPARISVWVVTCEC